jgi:hypothetical protein
VKEMVAAIPSAQFAFVAMYVIFSCKSILLPVSDSILIADVL